MYNFTFYQVDTVFTNPASGAVRVNHMVSPGALPVLEGSRPSFSVGSILPSTARPPYRAVLGLVPPARGVYYVDTSKGGLTVNNNYDAFLKVNFDVPDKHWSLADRCISGYSTAPEILQADAEGNGIYWFRVK